MLGSGNRLETSFGRRRGVCASLCASAGLGQARDEAVCDDECEQACGDPEPEGQAWKWPPLSHDSRLPATVIEPRDNRGRAL
jgi:hypothetical protein